MGYREKAEHNGQRREIRYGREKGGPTEGQAVLELRVGRGRDP